MQGADVSLRRQGLQCISRMDWVVDLTVKALMNLSKAYESSNFATYVASVPAALRMGAGPPG